MSKAGKNYAETIVAKPGKKMEDRIARQKACIDYETAKKEEKKARPALLKKQQEEREELVKARPDRIKARKAKKAEKSKAKQDKKAKENAVVETPVVTPEPVQIVTIEEQV